ncbi:MAG: SBBP repeat-containing protein [Anaerolineales bacterium]|nr:SBBP repeat-containing protein [Anaerolineales bacterium]
MGGTSSDSSYDISLDSNGNIYIMGSFAGTPDFDPGAGTASLTSAGEVISCYQVG